MMSIFSPPSSATTAWTRAPRWPTVAPTGSSPSWRDDDRDLRARAGLAGDRLDLDGPAVDLGHLELEQALQEALVRPADEDLRAAARAADLEHERLDVLADPVVLDGRLLGRREDRLDVVADVEDDRPRLDPVDRPVIISPSRFANWSKTWSRSTSRMRWRTICLAVWAPIRPKTSSVELLGLDEVARLGVGLEGARLLERELDERVLDLVDGAPGAEHADLARLGVDPDVDVLVAGDAAVGGLDAVLDRVDQLLSRRPASRR